MDRVDYTFKFSTELVVLVFSFIIIATNIFGLNTTDGVNNTSLFSKLLSYHPNQNLALYNKTTAVKTVVDNSSFLFPSASAKVAIDETDILSGNDGTVGTIDPTTVINNNVIERSNPASTSSLIANQIKVYDTQPGDTLNSISAKFGISPNTIKWANNLQSDTIKPGWNLVILPTSGVLHKVTANETLPDIAKHFSADINRIISYNNLLDDSDINVGDMLIIPDGSVPTPPPAKKAAPKKTIANKVGNQIVYEPVPDGVTDYSGGSDHIFPWGQCTYYASKRRGGVPWGGNAKDWLANAAAYGAKVGRVPVAGAIVVTTENRRYGHVGIVEQVNGDNFLISEMNYKGRGVIDQRWLNLGDPVIKGFIY